MYTVTTIIIACILCLFFAGGSVGVHSNYIIIDSESGDDSPSCLQSNITSCKSLSYVLSHISNNTEIILERDYLLEHTLKVTGINGLTISGNNTSIQCINSSMDTGSGLVIESVTNLRVLNLVFKDCGTLNYSTILNNGVNVKYRSAIYIVNSTNITFKGSGFHRNMGRGLTLHNVDGYVNIERGKFLDNRVPKEESI